MLKEERVMKINILHRQGASIQGIARQLGVSRNTVRAYLRQDITPVYGPRPDRASKLDPYKPYIEQRPAAARPHWVPASAIGRELREQGYPGSIRSLRYYTATLKPVARPAPVVRFETRPGQQIQVDWSVFPPGRDSLPAFVAALGWSRCSYVEFVGDERFATLKRCHENAFSYFQGVPQEVLYDHMKTVIHQRNAYGKELHRFHPGPIARIQTRAHEDYLWLSAGAMRWVDLPG